MQGGKEGEVTLPGLDYFISSTQGSSICQREERRKCCQEVIHSDCHTVYTESTCRPLPTTAVCCLKDHKE